MIRVDSKDSWMIFLRILFIHIFKNKYANANFFVCKPLLFFMQPQTLQPSSVSAFLTITAFSGTFYFPDIIYLPDQTVTIIYQRPMSQIENSFEQFLSFTPINFERSSSFCLEKERETTTDVCRIKRRTIEHLPLNKVTKKNGNMPKSIIGNFCKFLPLYSHLYSSRKHYQETHQMIKDWLKSRIDLNRKHLEILFGTGSSDKLENCKVLREIISNEGLEMIGQNTKVTNCLSYLTCLEKYIYRLANPVLTNRVQSR